MNVFEHSSNEPFTTSKVISKERLKTALEANVPESIKKNKKMMATWNERISGILTAYEQYTRLVCGGKKSPPKPKKDKDLDLWLAHEKKWDEFQLKLI